MARSGSSDRERRQAMAETDRRRLEALAKHQKRVRVAWIVGMWIVVGVPGLLLVWVFLNWLVVLFAVALVWLTWDYYRSGGMIDAIESSQRVGAWIPSAFDDRRPGR